MTETNEDFSNFGKVFADSTLKSFESLSSSAREIADEATSYAKNSFDSGNSAFEKMISAESFENAVEIQTDFAKQAYESFVAEVTKFSDLYANLAKEANKPFESAVAKAK